MNRPPGLLAEPSDCISRITSDPIGRAFVLKAGTFAQSTDALFDGSDHSLGLPDNLLLCAPAKCLLGCALDGI